MCFILPQKNSKGCTALEKKMVTCHLEVHNSIDVNN